MAYSLLRCDYAHADLGVEHGLKIPLCAAICKNTCCASEEAGNGYKRILTRLGKSHGFKLWTPDISHQFEKSKVSSSCMEIETDIVRGPFTSTAQVLKTYKDIMIQTPVAQETIRQLAMFAFYWDKVYNELPEEADNQRLELKQLRIGLNYASVLFFCKVIGPREQTMDAYSSLVNSSLDLAEEVMAAYHEGKPVPYMDRVVNGSLFSMAMCSRDPQHKERVMGILRGQYASPDGLDHWLRSYIIQLLVQGEDKVWAKEDLNAYLPRERITFCDMSCHEQTIRVDYAVIGPTTEWFDFVEMEVEWEPWFGSQVTSGMVHNTCQGIMAAYRTYGKPRPAEAPFGYVREMRHKGRPVQVLWEETWQPEDEDCEGEDDWDETWG
ncbi:hypothetical protein PRZ48_009126 [Zasmidium cellare]|uniref:Uncharacterized protein n=1 Tax=Zasmidium cellare TaxID=395010 RepID=A0ABR0EHH5_ZASCE|nr:hypothetical protein PRZ48_009126 [Zasmidium cellare]